MVDSVILRGEKNVRTEKRKKRRERKRQGGKGNAETGKEERKNEEIFALSRACHAVLREKTLSLSLSFSLSLPQRVATLFALNMNYA